MTTTASARITAAVAAALVSAGLLAGGATLSTTHSRNLADYGAAITAEDAANHARARGVPHMDDHRHAPGYFKRMNGGDR